MYLIKHLYIKIILVILHNKLNYINNNVQNNTNNTI